eukprot:Gb_12077 [translate_table: standard]
MAGTLMKCVVKLLPICAGVMVGLILGWSWKPKWANSYVSSFSPCFGYGFCCLALTPFCVIPVLRPLWSYFNVWNSEEQKNPSLQSPSLAEQEQAAVTFKDLENLCQLLQGNDRGPVWEHMMDRSIPMMSYQAWRREPEIGPTQYRSRTVIEGVTPELMRDFFWDDEFRSKWDNMLAYSKTIEECLHTGTTIFPFFCSDREYIIARRIWESGRTYFCISKGVAHPSVPRSMNPRRVDLFYSSWCIRAVGSTKGDEQSSACEVILFHHEEMGIPREIAKIGIRQGMWRAVKKIEPGVRAYQLMRKSGAPLSRTAYMAQINSRLPADHFKSFEFCPSGTPDEVPEEEVQDSSKCQQGNGWKWVLVCGAVVLAFGIDRGVLNNALIFGATRKLANLGKRLQGQRP